MQLSSERSEKKFTGDAPKRLPSSASASDAHDQRQF